MITVEEEAEITEVVVDSGIQETKFNVKSVTDVAI